MMKNWNLKYPRRFDLDTDEDYQQWREEKLAHYPQNINDLIVELNDMTNITQIEKIKILESIELSNMCIHTVGKAKITMNALLKLGQQLGVKQTDKSTRHAKSDELTNSGILNHVIPFSTRPARWHTDGTYYGSKKTVQSLFLLCKRHAIKGGSNKLLDHEILYILLRDKSPEALHVLMKDHCFKYKNPKTGEISQTLGGKVFWVNEKGYLCHRFSFRKMDMAWSEDKDVIEAKKILESLLINESKYVIEGKLETGMGLIANNILHTKEKFTDSEDRSKKRLLFRGRFYDRINA